MARLGRAETTTALAGAAVEGAVAKSLAGYFELWNDAMHKCDAIVTFPATVGRVAAYARPGLATVPGPHAG